MTDNFRPPAERSIATTGRLIIVSNRLPVRVTRAGGETLVHRADGGLASGLRGAQETHGGVWVGWPGDFAGIPAGERDEVMRRLADLSTVPVVLSTEEIDGFYHQISNGVLWPICHDRLDRLPLRVEGWDVYESVSRRYADAVAECWQPGDAIWVHDYHLFLLPQLLRDRLPEARIGFFLHIPFPNPEIFFTLSHRSAIVEGMMGSDLVGFHTRRYRGHFTAALRRLFRLEMGADETVLWRGRRVAVGIFPIGIDAAAFAERAARSEIQTHEIMRQWGDERVIVGVDRLDYAKGISRRLLAIERLLIDRPQWRGHARFIQVAIPSRGDVAAYRTFRDEVEALVGRINGTFATPTWTPIHYLHSSISDDVLSALYTRADVMLVTPLRDGMNLVAKEFVASRNDEDGVLVLSEFAGAVDELGEALIVNPYDVDSTALALHRALTMAREERRSRMRALRDHVFQNTVARWSTAYLSRLSAHERSER